MCRLFNDAVSNSRLYIVESFGWQWIMNRKECGRKRRSLISVTLLACPKKLRKTTKSLIRLVGFPVYICIGNLSDTSQPVSQLAWQDGDCNVCIYAGTAPTNEVDKPRKLTLHSTRRPHNLQDTNTVIPTLFGCVYNKLMHVTTDYCQTGVFTLLNWSHKRKNTCNRSWENGAYIVVVTSMHTSVRALRTCESVLLLVPHWSRGWCPRCRILADMFPTVERHRFALPSVPLLARIVSS
jgi:hypothetical protein